VNVLARRVERRAGLVPELQQRLASPSSRSDVLDRGWVRGLLDKNAGGASGLEYELTSYAPTGAKGRLLGHVHLPPAAHVGKVVDVGALERLLGDAPDMLFLLPSAYLESSVERSALPAGVRQVTRRLWGALENDAFAFAALFGGDLGGRILGMRVPCLMLGGRVRDAEEAFDSIGSLLDALNREHGLGLIPRRVTAGGRTLLVLDGSRAGLYSSLASSERPAVAVESGWLIFSSSRGALERLLGRGGEVSGPSRWRAGMEEGDGYAFGWMDIESAGQAVKNSLAVYSLVLMVRQSEGSAVTRAQLDAAREWIEVLAPLKTCSLWLDDDGSRTELRFRLGAPPEG
jgi:hypothetical protein